eukprot:CAMPEP_0202915078 /NCGR_PEP_ID=MMETSP1392-20130828/64780_1 /ASSEMBLY_ACC=CAM_ASM_000868 /TAXON_ID=225041 /ORGANISM="Chlamydomonas chlamydogama, Strain SAG 11-48b" /LENGTH=291 /DNA_ID=CAMNT_0049606973 /DNA_START=396 /DNA_END=1271 /DNA_ORIENTATION=+
MRIGNALSPYWHARGLAYLSGMDFLGDVTAYEGFFGKYLPQEVPKHSCPDPKAFKLGCNSCTGLYWEFAHVCINTWTKVIPEIGRDIPMALKIWAQRHNETIPVMQPGDVVIQNRCAPDTYLTGGDYGPTAFSYYLNAPRDTRRFLIMHDRMESKRFPPCELLNNMLTIFLQSKFPGAEVQVVSGTMFQDFARMVYAPVVFKDSQSSFGLWACLAALGVGGKVFAVPMRTKQPPDEPGTDNTPDFGPNWTWVTNVTTLYRDEILRAGLPLRENAAAPPLRAMDVMQFLSNN